MLSARFVLLIKPFECTSSDTDTQPTESAAHRQCAVNDKQGHTDTHPTTSTVNNSNELRRQAAVRAALRWRKAKVSAALNKWLYVADQSCFEADTHSVYQQYVLLKVAEALQHWRTHAICESSCSQ